MASTLKYGSVLLISSSHCCARNVSAVGVPDEVVGYLKCTVTLTRDGCSVPCNCSSGQPVLPLCWDSIGVGSGRVREGVLLTGYSSTAVQLSGTLTRC
jgi:hypothetical protein